MLGERRGRVRKEFLTWGREKGVDEEEGIEFDGKGEREMRERDCVAGRGVGDEGK